MVGEGHFSAGEIGGLFAGLVALLATLGHGIKWVLGFTSAQQARRSVKLQQWNDELDAREARLDAELAEYRRGIEREVAELRKWKEAMTAVLAATKTATQLLAGALRQVSPGNPALGMAEQLLRAFPLDPVTPAEMTGLLARLDDSEPGEKP